MTGTAPATSGRTAAAPCGPLGPWVEAHTEASRGGRTVRLLVNHRTCQVIELNGAEAEVCRKLATGHGLDASPATAAFVAELREQGFLASDPPPPQRRGLQLSAARLELRWAGAGRLVAAVYQRGARHLFRPAAIAAQILLALAGLAAVIAAITARQRFVLRVHPAQIPIVVGLSLAAVAVHELAHALVVVRHHRSVDAAGIRLHLGTPAFYVESASAVLLTCPQRIAQAASGVWAEWQFTSLVAIWLWVSPVHFAAPLLHRFVILNAATIASNLLPFTGLDGSWLLADATGTPDLTRRARGALSRLLTTLISGRPASPGDAVLAAYSTANGLAAAALLAAAGFFWYQLFGGLAATLAHQGPVGWAVLAAAAIILGRPAATAAAARLSSGACTAHGLYQAVAFRLQWRWRRPATAHLASAYPELAGLSTAQLGILAGHLHRTRRRGPLSPALGESYGIVQAGTIDAATASGQIITLTRGTTWNPPHQPRRAGRRTILIHIPVTTVDQILGAGPGAAAATWAAAL